MPRWSVYPLAQSAGYDMDWVPVSRPDLSGSELKYVTEAVSSSWISSSGEFLDRFEREFATTCQVSHALAVTNGTLALYLALAALRIGPGDEVIVPSLTYIAPVNAVRYVGATPVFADIDPLTWCLDPQAVESSLSSRTAAILPVHLYGQPADMDRIGAIARARGLAVVEDAAEAPFSTLEGRPAGSLGTVGTFSFYGNKIVTAGEGGAVTTHDAALADRMRLLRGQGMDPHRRYQFIDVGFNFRMTNVAAAILCAQLQRADQLLAARWSVYRAYERRLTHPWLEMQADVPGSQRSPWLFPLLLPDRQVRDAVAECLLREGVETRPFFPPVHRQRPYQELAHAQGASLPVTDHIADRGLSLPTFSGLSDDDIARIASIIDSVLPPL